MEWIASGGVKTSVVMDVSYSPGNAWMPPFSPPLKDAQAYDRIAAYFSSSVLEVAGEMLETVRGPVRVVRNLLDMPSAVWTGNHWIDEPGIEHPAAGPEGITQLWSAKTGSVCIPMG